MIDAREGRCDVIASELKDPAGKVVWSVENADFDTRRTPPAASTGCPTKTRFKSPREHADLLVEWGDRTVNPTLDDAKFVVQVPAGLPPCGAQR